MTIINVDTINPAEMIEQFDILYKAQQPALIMGSPGLGKSALVKQWAESKGYNLVTRMLSQTQPGDLSIPFFDKEEGVLHWAVADWLVQLPEDRPTVFFFDELPSAPIDVRVQVYQLVLDKKLGGHSLPDNCYIVAAGNRATDNASAFDIDTALADRFTHFVLKCDAKQWLDWAVLNNIHPTVLTFIKTRPDMLDDEDNMTDLVRRSPRKL